MATLADVHEVAMCAHFKLQNAPATASMHPTLELLCVCAHTVRPLLPQGANCIYMFIICIKA